MISQEKEIDGFELYRIECLTRYNDERLRGLVHHERWVKYMEEEQRWYDENIKRRCIDEP